MRPVIDQFKQILSNVGDLKGAIDQCRWFVSPDHRILKNQIMDGVQTIFRILVETDASMPPDEVRFRAPGLRVESRISEDGNCNSFTVIAGVGNI